MGRGPDPWRTADACFEVAQSTVSKYMVRPSKPPSQSWNTFLQNHAQAIAAIDMCVVPTLSFDRLFAFLVLGHGRRQLLWFEVTGYPTAEWLARQITEAFPWTSTPAYLLRDNDSAYGHVFTSRVKAMGIRDRPISPHCETRTRATALIASIADPKAFLAFTRAWLAAVPVRVISSPDRPNTRPPQRYRTTGPGA